ncbi:MAG TPA: penicillin acylase family protein [Candidatus Elarobacter sp.]|nr:penicillin acylase family protein [Candidatus Elarobacter sp.]
MPPKPLVSALSAAVLAAVLYAGARPVGPLPPLGALLDPAHGVWRAGSPDPLPAGGVTIPGMRGRVEVRYDARGVPHIFATTEDDAYRALGYVVARDRLFQLDVQTRAASGRLTELVGAAALKLDQNPRLLGMPRAAERKLAALDPASPTRSALDAYAEGVNAYIDALAPADYPIEYKLLNARPERWKPVNTMHLLNRMSWTLASGAPERAFARAAALVGTRAAESIFPRHTPIQEPIQPERGWTAPHDQFTQIAPPGAPDRGLLAMADLFGRFDADDATPVQHAFASNNWAVAPSRTRNGHALLAGDPHLDLTLPSIWYEAHLVVPGVLDVYGVTIPGAPGIVIGFNRDVAWTFTNTGADVMDFYRETVDDSTLPTRYRVDGEWRPIERRIERYADQHGATLHVDTVLYTHRGPMQQLQDEWVSMRWTALEPSDEMRAFRDASRAHTTREFEDAMGRSFFVPAQNMLVADRAGSIAIRSTGHYPIRPDNGDGRVIRDGSTSASDWKGFAPLADYPKSFDPGQGYLASANQEPQAPGAQRTYLGADTDFEVWRALRINELLRANSSVTPDDMRRWQTDPGSVRADRFVPYFLEAVRAQRARGRGDAKLVKAGAILAAWDRRYTKTNEGAVLFEQAMSTLKTLTWDELERDGNRVATPTDAVMAELLTQPNSAWWDDRRTPGVVEDRDTILAESLDIAYDMVVSSHGPPERGGWRWDMVQFANIRHLLRIPAFSALRIPVQGGRGTLSPSFGDGGHGASWRMVVELGPQVHAWATYPGGQSGDPTSPHYTDRLPKWKNGELDSLIFPRTPADLRATAATVVLVPKR